MWAAEGGFTDCVRVLLAAPAVNTVITDKVSKIFPMRLISAHFRSLIIYNEI